ncbi:hypothetical protein CLAFUW4_10709 [Fulvia fulva]|uniref:Uncharacterized protein n=1 Tax=Passalora fulva TaxID=5499 RepID=A0A9Q8LG60_PASFU|nr:uncharacterized protein CLAFUR5_05324 [Fulvia fulva]KAK4615357.1 hypothetical protein CLAFUR4_10714 [Fulvia fulva]KAK4617182.1 hypothetical protein CLAFUR0_10721 [Fulvia fulva]UJO16782.1 hypothetical protein CLAFUR5_05324 [Fulvia fulva]WPV19271.1 hypothetical protein CLAFUW4_10709 [Fulvia fulva]WPV34316.1 hypothetical protein CLAFUW7_10711 [Fulvia fulva]
MLPLATWIFGPRQGPLFCHSYRGADAGGKYPPPDWKHWVWVWNQRKLQQYDNQRNEQDLGSVFDRAEIEVTTGGAGGLLGLDVLKIIQEPKEDGEAEERAEDMDEDEDTTDGADEEDAEAW